MHKLVADYTKLFQDLQKTLTAQEGHYEKLSGELEVQIARLRFHLESRTDLRPNSLHRIILQKMLSALSTYQARCDTILKQIRSSRIDFDETLTTQQWVENAIATKEKLHESP
jgi:hypothetical protein